MGALVAAVIDKRMPGPVSAIIILEVIILRRVPSIVSLPFREHGIDTRCSRMPVLFVSRTLRMENLCPMVVPELAQGIRKGVRPREAGKRGKNAEPVAAVFEAAIRFSAVSIGHKEAFQY